MTTLPARPAAPTYDTPESDNYLIHDKGFLSWILTLDHKRIGVMYTVSVLLSFLVGGIFALLVRTELLTPGRTFIVGPGVMPSYVLTKSLYPPTSRQAYWTLSVVSSTPSTASRTSGSISGSPSTNGIRNGPAAGPVSEAGSPWPECASPAASATVPTSGRSEAAAAPAIRNPRRDSVAAPGAGECPSRVTGSSFGKRCIASPQSSRPRQ